MDSLSFPSRRPWRAPALAFVLTSACLLCAAVGLRADDDGGPSQDPVTALGANTLQVAPDALAGLSLTPAVVREVPDILSILGTISPVENRVTSVPARVAGRIDSVLKVTGQYVQAGEALALEYSPDYVEARQEYLEALQRDAAAKAGAQAPAQLLHASDFFNLASITRQKLENMGLTDADIAALPRNDGQDLVVRATHAGAITAVNTAVGNMQNQGDVLMVVSGLDRVWFDGDVFTEDLSKIRTGQAITIQTDGLSKPLHGRISFISPVIDPNAHTVKIRALVENPERALRAGMVVEGDVVLSREKALLVPLESVMCLYGNWYCYKRTGPGRFTRVQVEEGRETGDWAAIVRGLVPGDVVVSGGDLVLDFVFSSN